MGAAALAEFGFTLVGIARTHANIPDVARLNYIVQSLHLFTELASGSDERCTFSYRLFNGRRVVEAMAWNPHCQYTERHDTG